MRLLLLILFSTLPAAGKKEIDLVAYGQEVFHTVGCAECHSEAQDDASIKTGPGLYALLQKNAREREVLAGGEQHRQTIKADFKYFQQSLRDPNADLAIAEEGPTKGKAYLPVMPPYHKDFLSDFKVKAIYQYLLTLNEEKQRGPAKLMVEDKSRSKLTNVLDDPNEILVTDRTRIYRTRLKEQSARAVYVGTPQGLNYAFDPVSLSIERIWWGGFLNIAGSLDGRGMKPSRLGHNTLEVELKVPLLAPLHPQTGKPIDLSFKSPRMDDFETIAQTLNSDLDFSEQLAQAGGTFFGYEQAEIPTFYYGVGQNTFQVQFAVNESGQAKLSLKGKLTAPQTFRLAPLIKGKAQDWTVSSLPAELTFQVPVKPAWRPTEAKQAPREQAMRITPAQSVNLPPGYLAEQVAAPTDSYGRDQMFEPLGMANGKDGSLIIATRTAGIWKLNHDKWTQIAEGFQDCLGVLEEEDGSLIITQKPELTRLRDLDGDGWFERHETLSADFLATANYHTYLHGPAKGIDGNYYVALNLAHHNDKKAIYKAGGKYMGTEGGYRGWALQVNPSGKTTPFASGLRSPAGLATGPDGQLYYTENQGEYVGTSKLFLLEKDKFYGHPSGLVDLPGMKSDSPEIQWEQVKDTKEKALALTPHSRLANAPGSPAWHPETQEMFVGDQTLSTLFRILPKENNEAALIPFADGFPSGVMRLAFRENGDLFVGQTGRGWRAKGGSEHALVVIKRDEKPESNYLRDITKQGHQFTLHFSQAIKTELADIDFHFACWSYLDSPSYGSPENDKFQLEVQSVEFGKDNRTLILTTEPCPEEKKNWVYLFRSDALPFTKENCFEAFYSVVRE